MEDKALLRQTFLTDLRAFKNSGIATETSSQILSSEDLHTHSRIQVEVVNETGWKILNTPLTGYTADFIGSLPVVRLTDMRAGIYVVYVIGPDKEVVIKIGTTSDCGYR